MPGVPREVTEHKLKVKPDSRPVHQKLRRFSPEKTTIIKDNLEKLLAAGFIHEIHHSDWLANPVIVKKKRGKWRMCVDHTGLNASCPKDNFPLPRINMFVNATAIARLLSFFDAYSCYHQVPLTREDEEKMAFIKPFRTYF